MSGNIFSTKCRWHFLMAMPKSRTNKSQLLVSYLFSIGDPRHPSPLCPLCLMHDHTSSHLFECKSLPTSLSSLDLWTNPDKVEPFLATWGRDCWLPHDSGAGLCWQHVGGVGSTTTTTTNHLVFCMDILVKCEYCQAALLFGGHSFQI